MKGLIWKIFKVYFDLFWRRKWQPTPVFLSENPMDRGAWWDAVHGVTKSQTRLHTKHNIQDDSEGQMKRCRQRNFVNYPVRKNIITLGLYQMLIF